MPTLLYIQENDTCQCTLITFNCLRSYATICNLNYLAPNSLIFNIHIQLNVPCLIVWTFLYSKGNCIKMHEAIKDMSISSLYILNLLLYIVNLHLYILSIVLLYIVWFCILSIYLSIYISGLLLYIVYYCMLSIYVCISFIYFFILFIYFFMLFIYFIILYCLICILSFCLRVRCSTIEVKQTWKKSM